MTPIRRGTARRLGLRQPKPRGYIVIDRRISDEQVALIRERSAKFGWHLLP